MLAKLNELLRRQIFFRKFLPTVLVELNSSRNSVIACRASFVSGTGTRAVTATFPRMQHCSFSSGNCKAWQCWQETFSRPIWWCIGNFSITSSLASLYMLPCRFCCMSGRMFCQLFCCSIVTCCVVRFCRRATGLKKTLGEGRLQAAIVDSTCGVDSLGEIDITSSCGDSTWFMCMCRGSSVSGGGDSITTSDAEE